MSHRFITKINQLAFLPRILILWGILWGFLGLTLFFIGLAGLYYRGVIIFVLFLTCIFGIYLGKKLEIGQGLRIFLKNSISFFRKDLISLIFLLAIFAFLLINFFAALAPELGYDALWYHLTLPKIWLMNHQISYIPGGVLYYSVMPKLGEIFFSVGLAIEQSGTIAKLIHFSFGVSWILAIFIFCRIFLSRRISLMISAVIYGTVLVSWLSQTAYIDLIVGFYVAMGLWAALKYWQTKDGFYLILSGIFIGLNLAAKIYGLIIFTVLTIVLFFKAGFKKTWIFIDIALLIVLPFYLQAYFSTGNPLYPVFSIRDSALQSYLDGFNTMKDWYLYAWWKGIPELLWRTLVYDFTPILAFVVLVPLLFKERKILLPAIIFLLFFLLWSLIPVHEPRYFLVILPVLGLLVGFVLEKLNGQVFKIIVIALGLLVISVNFYKVFTNYQKRFRFVFSHQTRGEYLGQNLPLSLNFYDADGGFAKNVGPSTSSGLKILTVEVGNMFYIDFPFWDWSFIADNKSYLTGQAKDLNNRLKTEGYSYVILGKLSLSDWNNFPENEIKENFELIYQKEELKLYKIK